jgi:uncharacterized membrane protein HdeD (DUF308 family)
MMKKKSKRRWGIVATVGFVFLYLTAGAGDLGNISRTQEFIQAIIGLALFVAGIMKSGD